MRFDFVTPVVNMGACGAVPAVACVQTITKLWLVPSAKQRRDPCSGHPTDSTNYRKCVSNSPSIWLAITTNKTKPFLTGQSWRVLKSGYTAGSPEQGFRRSFADGVNQSLISSARRLFLLLYRKKPGVARALLQLTVSGNWAVTRIPLKSLDRWKATIGMFVKTFLQCSEEYRT